MDLFAPDIGGRDPLETCSPTDEREERFPLRAKVALGSEQVSMRAADTTTALLCYYYIVPAITCSKQCMLYRI